MKKNWGQNSRAINHLSTFGPAKVRIAMKCPQIRQCTHKRTHPEKQIAPFGKTGKNVILLLHRRNPQMGNNRANRWRIHWSLNLGIKKTRCRKKDQFCTNILCTIFRDAFPGPAMSPNSRACIDTGMSRTHSHKLHLRQEIIHLCTKLSLTFVTFGAGACRGLSACAVRKEELALRAFAHESARLGSVRTLQSPLARCGNLRIASVVRELQRGSAARLVLHRFDAYPSGILKRNRRCL